MADAIAFDEKGYEQHKKIAREVMRRMMNPAQMRGRWQQRESGGAGGHHIWFTIESVVCNADNSKTLFVTPTYYTGGCTKAIPGEDEYGQVQVEDPCSILDFYTQAFLESGVTGRATYMYPRGAEYCEPVWLVDQICGQPECA